MIRSIVVASLLLPLACSARGESLERAPAAILRGEPAPEGPPWAVALVAGSDVECSAALVAPRLVLTAAHCLGKSPARVRSHEGVDVAIVDAVAHPAFRAGEVENDLAIVVLARALDAPFASFGPPPEAGAKVTVYGYGADDEGRFGARRRGTMEIVASSATVSLRPSPSAPCVGDSGGPVVSDGRVVAVVSQARGACLSGSMAARVDASFVASVAASIAARDLEDGVRCLVAESCRGGICDRRGRSARFCASPCASTCRQGFVCEASRCVPEGAAPGEVGASCASTSECVDAVCHDRSCRRACTFDGDCGGDATCRPISGALGVCVAREPSGGCALSSTPPHASSALGTAALLLVVVRRRCSTMRRRCRALASASATAIPARSSPIGATSSRRESSPSTRAHPAS